MKATNSNTKDHILEKIKKGDLSIRPRWHFVLKSMLAFLGIALVGVVAVYLLSFIIFVLHSSGVAFAPLLGPSGIIIFILASPWLLVILTIGFLITLEILVRKYAFGYRKPLLYTGLIIVSLVMFGTYLIAQTPMHQHFKEMAKSGDFAFISAMYEQYGENLSDMVYPGTIIEVTSSGYVMRDSRGELRTVIIGPDTFIPDGTMFKEGQTVVVLGPKSPDGSIAALGTRIVPEGMPPIPPGFKKEEKE